MYIIHVYKLIGEKHKHALSGVFSLRGIHFHGFDFLRWKLLALSVWCVLPPGEPQIRVLTFWS